CLRAGSDRGRGTPKRLETISADQWNDLTDPYKVERDDVGFTTSRKPSNCFRMPDAGCQADERSTTAGAGFRPRCPSCLTAAPSRSSAIRWQFLWRSKWARAKANPACARRALSAGSDACSTAFRMLSTSPSLISQPPPDAAIHWPISLSAAPTKMTGRPTENAACSLLGRIRPCQRGERLTRWTSAEARLAFTF